MSLSSALNAAATGLDLSSRRADLVARNIANSDTAGYARRELVGSGPAGLPGSKVSISRGVDPRMVQLRREAQSREAGGAVTQKFQSALDAAIGDPDQAGSLQEHLAHFDSTLITAATDPGALVGLKQVSSAAHGLAEKLNTLDQIVRDYRQNADTDIGRAVSQLNSDLSDVERLNASIRRLRAGGNDAADLIDRRSVLIDRIGQFVPVREISRDNDGVALVSDGGILLLDGRAATFGFSPRMPITPAMSVPVQLSELTVNGRVVDTAGSGGGIRGGSLAALFSLRDEVAPEATARLDGVAVELISRFEGSTIDTTRAVGSPGLFTDLGSAFDPLAPKGIAGRIQLNVLVAPDQPSQHYKLRDGLGAPSPSSGSDASLLLRYAGALADRTPPVAVGLPNITADIQGHVATLRSMISADRVRADDHHAFHRTEAAGLVEGRDGAAVDLDAEMRNLLRVEQAYAANARVMQAVSDMMNRLTEI